MSRAKPSPRRVALTLLRSFAAGLLAGLIFWALRVPSPAPPWLALTGLLGIVIGEHAVARVSSRRRIAGQPHAAHSIDPDHT